MKTILCFGDSNTFGTNPFTGGRWPEEVRWTGILQQRLGRGFRVIEEGLGGRTSVWDDPLAPDRNGRSMLPMLLDSHKPLDLVIIMLGTNDWKARFHALPEDIACGIGQLAALVRTHPFGEGYGIPKVLLVSPVLLGKDVEHSVYPGFLNEAAEKSGDLAPLVKTQADLQNCLFFDAASVAKPSETDMLHMEESGHAALASALSQLIQSTG